jgi:predicted phage terminase large subunit-like protein
MSAPLARRLTPSAFRDELAALQDSLRRRIELEVDGFPADPVARDARIATVADPERGFRFFVETYFPHYVRAAPNALHLHLFERLPRMIRESRPGRRGARLVEKAPRGSAKSTIATQLFSLWCIVRKLKRFIMVVMDAYDQAALMVEAIKIELEENPRLASDFPDAVGAGRTWREGEIVTQNDVRLQGLGTGQKVRGRRHGPYRPDLVLLDDVENDEDVRNPRLRDKLQNWILKAVEPVGAQDGSIDIVMLGTMLHFDSVLQRLATTPGWEGHTFKAIERWPDRMDLWDRFSELAINAGEPEARAFYEARRAEMDAGAVLFWPAMKPLVDLMWKRATNANSFGSEDQNEPFNDQSPFKDLTFWVLKKAEWIFFGAVDPSLGRKGASRDPSAILIGGWDRASGVLDVVEASIRRRLPDVIIADVIALAKEYRPALWAVEAVQFQEFLRTELMKRAVLEGVALPAIPVVPNTDKLLRIERLQPPIAAGLVRLHPTQSVLLDQLRQFPNGDHDDGPDALEMLWSLAVEKGGGLMPGAIVSTAAGDDRVGGYRMGAGGLSGFRMR